MCEPFHPQQFVDYGTSHLQTRLEGLLKFTLLTTKSVPPMMDPEYVPPVQSNEQTFVHEYILIVHGLFEQIQLVKSEETVVFASLFIKWYFKSNEMKNGYI